MREEARTIKQDAGIGDAHSGHLEYDILRPLFAETAIQAILETLVGPEVAEEAHRVMRARQHEGLDLPPLDPSCREDFRDRGQRNPAIALAPGHALLLHRCEQLVVVEE